jgi:putative oxidoreductase
MLLPVRQSAAARLASHHRFSCFLSGWRTTVRKNLPILLVRVVVGLVFLTEGVLKFVEPGDLGSGRFAHIGLPFPHLLAPFVAIVEILAGAAMIFGVYAGDAAVLLLIVILTAIFTTKVPILLGHHFGRFEPPHLSRYGLLAFLHESRTDLCMLFGCVAVLFDSGLTMGHAKRLFQR